MAPMISAVSWSSGPMSAPVIPSVGGGGGGGGGGGAFLASNSTFSNSIASSSGGGHNYAQASTNISTSFGDFGRIGTNGTYTIVSDPDMNIFHTGTGTQGSAQECPNAGWGWIVRNSDGAIMKSWNGVLNGDHGDSSIQQQYHNTLGTRSIGVNATFGQTCAINDNYAFIMAVFRPSGGHTTENFDNHRAYIFSYKLSDFTLAKVWKVNDFYTQIDAYTSAPSYSSFGSGLGEHGMQVTNDSMYIPSGYTAHQSNTSYPGGAVSYFDISNPSHTNWPNAPAVFKTPLAFNTTTNIGGSNYSNGNFGSSGVYSVGTKVIVTHATRAHYYQRSGNSFSETSSYTPNYYIGRPYNAILSSGKVAMTTGDQSQKTLTLRDPANSWSQDWQVNLTSNGYPGYRTIVDPDTDKILVGDPSHDENATNDGLIRVFNDDGTVNQTVVNPTSTNTFFGIGFAVKNGKLVSKVRVGGSSSNIALQFMTLTYGGGGGGGAVWYGARGVVAGGYTQNPTAVQNVIQYFNIGSPENATDFGDLTQARVGTDAVSNGTRAVFGGGYNGASSHYNTIDYITTATTGNAQDFGDLFVARARHGSASDGTKGIFAGGHYTGSWGEDTIDSITIATPGNATDFGNLTVGRDITTGWNNATRGVFAGGMAGGSTKSNVIDYITIASAGNATDFGDMTDTWSHTAGAGDATYALFAGGRRTNSSNSNGWTENIDYITVATTGNATDFGDLIRFKGNMSGCADGIKACFSGGDSNTGSNVRLAEIDTVVVATPGNATDFGDLLEAYEDTAATSGSAS